MGRSEEGSLFLRGVGASVKDRTRVEPELRVRSLDFGKRAAAALPVMAMPVMAMAIMAVAVASPAVAQRTATPAPRIVQSTAEGFATRHISAIDTATAWGNLVGGAVRTIDIASPSLVDAPGSAVTGVFAQLREAAQRRGVRVRVLLDAMASKANGATAAELAGAAGIEVRRIAFPAGMDGAYVVADSTHAMLGSQRFDWRSISENHELGVLFEGRAAERLERLFEHDWRAAAEQASGRKFDTDPARETGAAEIATLLDREPMLAVSPPMGGQIAAIDALTAVISASRKNLDIEITAFSTAHVRPWTELRVQITGAARRGVAVRLAVSDRQLASKSGLADLQALARLPGVEVRISTLPARTAGCVPFTRLDNARLVVADAETVWIGGGTWSYDGFYAARSAAFVARNRDLAAETLAIFQTNWTSTAMRTVRTNMPLPPAPDLECRRSQNSGRR